MTLPHVRQKKLTAALNAFRDAEKRSWILLNPTSLGDTVVVCALAKSFKQTHGGSLTMVVPDQQLPLAQMYAKNIDRILTLPRNVLEEVSVDIAEAQSFDIDQPYVAHPFWHGDGRCEHYAELFTYPKRGGIGFCDLFRDVLRLDWSSTFEPPVIPDEWRLEAEILAAKIGMVPGRSVIFFPDNNSNPPFPATFWEPLAAELIKNGWKVFTNLAGNARGQRAEPFRGTSAITIPLHLAIPLVEIAGRYIAGNNGLICTLLIAKARSQPTILIYNKSYVLNNYDAKLPIPLQSFRYSGFIEEPIPEYLVNPDEDMSSIIVDIAVNNPATQLVW